MILGYKEAKTVKGYFKKFIYHTIIINGNKMKRINNVLYAENETRALYIIDYWNSKCTGTCSMYEYGLMSKGEGKYNASDIVDLNKTKLMYFDENLNYIN